MNWFFASGDLDFFWPEQLKALSWLPAVFRKDIGFGVPGLLSLWLDYPFRLLLKVLSSVGLSWFIIDKILWLSVFVLGIYSSYRLAAYILGRTGLTWLSPIIYVANTYMLLLFSGGQLGVSWAYAFTPWVLVRFLETIDREKTFNVKQGLTTGLFLALLMVFDIRFAYMLGGMLVLYVCLHLFKVLSSGAVSLSHLAVPVVVAVCLHAFWILPLALGSTGLGGVGGQFTNPGMLKFLSFADFSHALSLLHPNWPENLFGKVYFLQPEFLVLPILAFASLLSKPKGNEKQHVLFFAFLGLLGAFLAKGVQPPFGDAYRWMFEHIPGFVLFRDPTKLYILTAIAYATLIPYTLRALSARVSKAAWIVPVFFLIFWVFTVRALFTGTVTGNFRPLILTSEYVQLKDLLAADSVSSRTLWLPGKEKFAYASDTHPLLVSEDMFPSASVSAVIGETKKSSFTARLSDAGVKYVIVPVDMEHRLFLDDYHFAPGERESLVQALSATPLTRNKAFSDIAVFENPQFSFYENIPAATVRQQQLANIGVLVSGLSLIVVLVMSRRS